MTQIRLLIVSDDKNVSDGLVLELTSKGYQVSTVSHRVEDVNKITRKSLPLMILLDTKFSLLTVYNDDVCNDPRHPTVEGKGLAGQEKSS